MAGLYVSVIDVLYRPFRDRKKDSLLELLGDLSFHLDGKWIKQGLLYFGRQLRMCRFTTYSIYIKKSYTDRVI